MRKGQKQSEETKKMISIILKKRGIHPPLEVVFKKGHIPWNKGKRGYKTKPCSEERKKKISIANFKGGKPKCIDCGKKLASIYAKRCKICAGKLRKGENNVLWKGGKPKCPICKKEISYNAKGCNKHSAPSGANNYHWIMDRTQLVRKQERNDSAYYAWRLEVWRRDSFKCKINNQDCSGKIIAHHILGWSEFPELRYEVNNGITLCHAHHPLKRVEEKQSIPFFMEMIEAKV
jgi:hypothetical protein